VLNSAARVITGTRKFDRGLGEILYDQLHLRKGREGRGKEGDKFWSPHFLGKSYAPGSWVRGQKIGTFSFLAARAGEAWAALGSPSLQPW